MADKTNYAQSLMHMIKGNLGTGILAMPASFAHTGLINALFGLPILCLVSTYCVHLLVKSSQQLEGKSKSSCIQYASLAKQSFKSGPRWMRSFSDSMCWIVDGTLLVAQIGVCCVYLVFVVDNITSILASNNVKTSKTIVFLAILPVALLLSYIRTLKRLAIASTCANLLQAIGISVILEYLWRDLDKVNLAERDNFRPLSEVALGFGSAMFAFEGISVVLPIYSRMKHSDRMSGYSGVINLSYVTLLILNFTMGLFGFLKFGRNAGDSITLNLPPEPIYDAVRAMFAISVFLTYPLQFYVPNEIIWQWVKKNLLMEQDKIDIPVECGIEVVIPSKKGLELESDIRTKGNGKQIIVVEKKVDKDIHNRQTQLVRYEYYCRTVVVMVTFLLAISIPKLNLLMDLIGSITGTSLSLIIPAIIHIATFWDDTNGIKLITMITIDSIIIAFGFLAGGYGSVFSFAAIIESFSHH